MEMVETAYEHIVLNEQGIPIIEGTTTKVVELVVERIAYGWSPEEMHFQHPYLSLGQIYSAMAYYWDHEEALNQDIRQRNSAVEHLRQAAPPSLLASKLRAKGAV